MSDQASLRWVRLARHLGASPERVFRVWTVPEELTRWFPLWVEGSLARGSRSELVFTQRRMWIDVQAAEPNSSFVFRRPWLPDDSWITTVTVTIERSGTGSLVRLEDGPFDIARPEVLAAFEEALVGWAEVLAFLRAHVDFFVDLRPTDF